VDVAPGITAPFYILPFDKKGRCEAPLTRDHLLRTLEEGSYTHVFLFSHGWNNDWAAATQRYDDFIAGFQSLRDKLSLPLPNLYHPLLVGVIWPSTALVLPWEEAPDFAADATVAEDLNAVREIAADLPDENVTRFYELSQRGQDLTPDEAKEMASLLVPLYQRADDEAGQRVADAISTTEELVQIWRTAQPDKKTVDTSGEFGFADDEGAGLPEAAPFPGFLDPRLVLRLVTVRQMKDRAGTVGYHGVAPLLRELLSVSTARAHLVGHSYGCKVILSALCAAAPPRQVESLLLFQPAVSHLSFAQDADGKGTPGGYRSALAHVRQPILTTFTRRDLPLHKAFHLALRRSSDLGEVQIAAGAAPSRFAALGGYGPSGFGPGEVREIPMKRPPGRYELGADAPEIYALRADDLIAGHGDISNEATWWALYNQLMA